MGDEGKNDNNLFYQIYEKLDDLNEDHSSDLSPYVINGIAIIVTIVWAGSFVADVSLDHYNPPSQIHMVMLAIVGSIFGFQFVHRGGGK